MQQCIRQGCCQGNVFELTDDNYYRGQVFPMHAHLGVGYGSVLLQLETCKHQHQYSEVLSSNIALL